jgi:hypothetical protein
VRRRFTIEAGCKKVNEADCFLFLKLISQLGDVNNSVEGKVVEMCQVVSENLH